MRILYLHGLGSGRNSRTAGILQNLLEEHEVLAPEIPIQPKEAFSFLKANYTRETVDIVIGTSLGGFYTLLVPGVPRIMVNPALFPDEDIREKIGLGEQPFFSERSDGRTTYTIDDQFIQELAELRAIAYQGLNEKEKEQTYGLFGKEDELLSHQEDYKRIFSEKNFTAFHDGHRLSPWNINNYLLPKTKEVIALLLSS